MSEQNLLQIIREIKEFQILADELAATIEGLKDQVKNHMTAIGVDKLTVDIHKVSYTPVSTTRIDTTALKKEMPDVAARYSKTSETRRFQIA